MCESNERIAALLDEITKLKEKLVAIEEEIVEEETYYEAVVPMIFSECGDEGVNFYNALRDHHGDTVAPVKATHLAICEGEENVLYARLDDGRYVVAIIKGFYK